MILLNRFKIFSFTPKMTIKSNKCMPTWSRSWWNSGTGSSQASIVCRSWGCRACRARRSCIRRSCKVPVAGSRSLLLGSGTAVPRAWRGWTDVGSASGSTWGRSRCSWSSADAAVSKPRLLPHPRPTGSPSPSAGFVLVSHPCCFARALGLESWFLGSRVLMKYRKLHEIF